MARRSRFSFNFFPVVIGLSVLVGGAAESLQAAVSSERHTSSASSQGISGIDSSLQTAQEEIRDPFKIAAETEAAVATTAAAASASTRPEIAIVLQGIGFGSKNEGYAVIGDDIYYKGEEINGIKLLEVRRREVDILVNGGKMTVPLFRGTEVAKARERAKKKGAVKDAPANPPGKTPSSLSKREQPKL
jgi:hypothetical protein